LIQANSLTSAIALTALAAPEKRGAASKINMGTEPEVSPQNPVAFQ
jgi:hypothetical protein